MSKQKNQDDEQAGCSTNLFVAFIFIFFFPIMWLAKKFDTGGPGAGIGSFFLAAFIILGGLGTVALGCAIAFGWLVFH